MAPFDVYHVETLRYPLILDVQASFLAYLASRVVVPLAPHESAQIEELPRLKPRLSVCGRDYVMLTTEIGVAPANLLGEPIANIEHAHRDAITGALDFLFQGF